MAAFMIRQQLYVSKSDDVVGAVASFASDNVHVFDKGEDLAITLASGEDETIGAQYAEYRSFHYRLSNIFASLRYKPTIVLSVVIEAYEYIPEISLPNDLVADLARMNASVDFDVINMIES